MTAAVQNTKSNNKLIMAVMLFGAFISILNQTLLVAALPSIMRDLQVTANQVQWLTTGFMLVNGIMIPVTAFLINKLTNRQLYLGAMAIFAIGTGIAAFAPNFHILLFSRILQAVGAGVIMPMMQTVMLYLFPKEQRGYAMGIMGIVIGFAPAIGPTLSGFLVDALSWHALFYVVCPIAILNIVISYFLMRNMMERTNPKLDILSVILSTIGFGGLLYGFSNAGSEGWLHLSAWLPIVIGILVLIMFVSRQFKLEEPLLELRVFRSKSFVYGTLLAMLMFSLMISAENQLPMYIQTARGYSALTSGLTLLPGAIMVGIMSPVTGKLFDKFGPRLLALLGLGITFVTTLFFAFISMETPLWDIMLIYMFRLLGISMLSMPMTTWGINGLENRHLAHGTAVNATLRQVTASLMTAFLITIMTSAANRAEAGGMDAAAAMVHGIDISFMVTLIIIALLFIFSFFFVHDYEQIAAIHQKKSQQAKG